MGYILKTKDGRCITRPISHPATDQQVYAQLSRMQDEGRLILPTEDLAPRVQELEDRALGETDPGDPEVSWSIGMMQDATGEPRDDPQGMRLRSNKLTALAPLVVRFANTAKYKYYVYYYRPDGTYDPREGSWETAASFRVEKGWQIVIKVRENNYAVWNAEKIAAFAATVTIRFDPDIGFDRRIAALEAQTRALESLDETVRANTNGILALKNTVAGLGNVENASLLLQYNDNFFPELEYGEISWENGADIGTSHCYARSVGYQPVNADDAAFLVSIPEGVLASFYAYSLAEDGYVFEGPSSWFGNGGSFRPVKGKYYRALFYSAAGVQRDGLRVVLSGSVLTGLLDSMTGGRLLNEQLTTAEALEMEQTSAAIASAGADAGSALIGFFTDLHMECGSPTTSTGVNITRTKKHLTMYNKLSKRHRVDLLVFGGDYLQNSSQTDKLSAAHTLELLREFISRTDDSAPIAVLKGNHDDNTMHTDYRNGYLSDEERWRLVQSFDESATCRDTDSLERSYGYYDIPNRRIRVFYLNTIDIPTRLNSEENTIAWPGQGLRGFSGEQIQFVADHLKFDEPGWQVLFFSHHSIKRNPFAAPATNAGVTAANGGSVMEQVLQGFLAGDAGTIENTTEDFTYTVSFDFTKNRSNTIIACINGHTHYDAHAYLDGINWIATRAIDGHAAHGLKDTSVYIVVDRKGRTISLIANGEGEDRAYRY